MGVFLLKNDGEHDDDKNDLEEREEVVLLADDDDAEEVSLEMSVFSISRFNDCVTPWDRLILSSKIRLKSVVVENKKKATNREEILTSSPRF